MDASGLQCIICPGQPVFSDVSHLLTHVSSKAHLAHQFKLQVRSHQAADAAELLNAYNAWFNTNNLAQLLSDRSSSKEDRKNKRRSSGKKAVRAMTKSTPKSSVPADLVDTNSGARATLPDFIDPRLADPYKVVKHEVDTEDESFVSNSVTRSTSAAKGIHPDLEADRDSASSAGNTEFASWYVQDATPDANASQDASLPMTPKPPRARKNPNASFSQLGADKLDPFVDNRGHLAIVDEDDIDNDRVDEMARLKGVLWPGMDIFDAATQQMRRKRNQKKDGTILKQMETTSRLVEPTEQIFSITGALLKERVISGNVEDDSPLEGETPIPKKGQLRGKRGILRDHDPNILRGRDRKRPKREVPQSRDKSEEALDIPEPEGLIYHKATFGSAFDGEDEEMGLSMRAFGKRPRTGFTVFNDEDDQDNRASMMKDHGAISQAPRGTLTPARLVLSNQPNISYNHGHRIQSPQGKENIEPILNTRGRIDPPIWNPTSPFLKRSDPVMNSYAPRTFFDENSNTGLGLAGSQDMYGYRFNPLLAPTSKMTMFDHPSYDEEVTLTSSGWTAISRAMSSEATVSEEDHHETTRAYLNANAAD